jgi:hypothetical protein
METLKLYIMNDIAKYSIIEKEYFETWLVTLKIMVQVVIFTQVVI